MARWDFIKSLAELDAFIFAEADENGRISAESFERLTGVYSRDLRFDLLDIRSDLTKFLLERGVIACHVFDNGMNVHQLYAFIYYYSRDDRDGLSHVSSRNSYLRAKKIFDLTGLESHLAKIRP